MPNNLDSKYYLKVLYLRPAGIDDRSYGKRCRFTRTYNILNVSHVAEVFYLLMLMVL